MDPQRTALLVMDVQPGIVERLGSETLLARLTEAIDAARRAGVQVIFVKVGFRPGYPEVSARNPSFSRLRDFESFIEGVSSDVHPALAPQRGDIVVTKRRVSAFSGSDLELLLRARTIDSLVLCGIATSGVVLSTLRQAADLDFALAVLADGCADADPELHVVLLERVFPRQAQVLTVADWVAALQRA
ncbi:MAG TPA: cysteine hydrolase [Solirubrobacteraceae bacterium]|nr:cysteine hydrolase [Solirubrobacteraceae bacterium]